MMYLREAAGDGDDVAGRAESVETRFEAPVLGDVHRADGAVSPTSAPFLEGARMRSRPDGPGRA